jgi:hypothetical protein
MITRENLQNVINSMSIKDKKRVLNTEKEYVVIYLHICNSGSYTTIRLTDDFNRYKNVSNNGNVILTSEEVKDLIISGLTKKIFDFAKDHKSGFTLNINTLQPVKSGYVVSYKETQDSFDFIGLQNAVIHAINHDGIVGGWFNEKNSRYYFDSNKVFNSITKAIAFGVDNEQIAIFDLDDLHEIRLDELT